MFSWGEKLWAQKSSCKLNRFLVSRRTSTKPSGELWLVCCCLVGMVWLDWYLVGMVWSGLILPDTCYITPTPHRKQEGTQIFEGWYPEVTNIAIHPIVKILILITSLRWCITWRRQRSSRRTTSPRGSKQGLPGRMLPSDRWTLRPNSIRLTINFLVQDIVLGKGLVRKPDGVISSIKIYGIKDL